MSIAHYFIQGRIQKCSASETLPNIVRYAHGRFRAAGGLAGDHCAYQLELLFSVYSVRAK